MATQATPPFAAPPPTVRVDVDFYDAAEQSAFKRGLAWPTLQALPAPINVSTADLCAYYLYYKLRPGITGFGSHSDLASVWVQALEEFRGQVEFASGSLRLLSHVGMSTGTTERLGEAFGLAVTSALHGLHPADWHRIPKAQHKTLDFTQPPSASTGQVVIELETKGSAVGDNKLKPSNVGKHRASIQGKKAVIPAGSLATGIHYGTISVLGDAPASVVRCWLVDPPAESIEDPERYKVIARLSYIADLLSFLGSRSPIAIALRNRIAALNALASIGSLSGVPLVSGLDVPIEEAVPTRLAPHHPWFSGKSVVERAPIGGQVFSVKGQRIFFIGIDDSLLDVAARQDFEEVKAYKVQAGLQVRVVDCVVPRGRFDAEFSSTLRIPDHDARSKSSYVSFRLSGVLHSCTSGLVFGILSLPDA